MPFGELVFFDKEGFFCEIFERSITLTIRIELIDRGIAVKLLKSENFGFAATVFTGNFSSFRIHFCTNQPYVETVGHLLKDKFGRSRDDEIVGFFLIKIPGFNLALVSIPKVRQVRSVNLSTMEIGRASCRERV